MCIRDSLVSVSPHQDEHVRASFDLHRRFGADVRWYDEPGIRGRVASPTYRCGFLDRAGAAVADPARLAWGLAVSYTHLDVYKRQPQQCRARPGGVVLWSPHEGGPPSAGGLRGMPRRARCVSIRPGLDGRAHDRSPRSGPCGPWGGWAQMPVRCPVAAAAMLESSPSAKAATRPRCRGVALRAHPPT